MPATQEAVQQSLGMLYSVHKDLDYLATVMSYQLGGSVCVADCGLCCHETLIIPQVSALWIASAIKTLPDKMQRFLIERLEKWLLREIPDVRRRFSEDGEAEQALRKREYESVGYGAWCPFLADDSKCLIYPWRDIVCRSWGVTLPVGSKCPRPVYAGETKNQRKYVKVSELVHQQISSMTTFLKEHYPEGMRTGWLPNLVYMNLKPDKWPKLRARMQQAKYSIFNSDHLWLITAEETEKYQSKWNEREKEV